MLTQFTTKIANRRNREEGVSMLEIIITMVIFGIITAITFSTMDTTTRASANFEAKSSLTDAYALTAAFANQDTVSDYYNNDTASPETISVMTQGCGGETIQTPGLNVTAPASVCLKIWGTTASFEMEAYSTTIANPAVWDNSSATVSITE